MRNGYFAAERGDIDDPGKTAFRQVIQGGKRKIEWRPKMNVQCILKIFTIHGIEGTNDNFSRVVDQNINPSQDRGNLLDRRLDSRFIFHIANPDRDGGGIFVQIGFCPDQLLLISGQNCQLRVFLS